MSPETVFAIFGLLIGAITLAALVWAGWMMWTDESQTDL